MTIKRENESFGAFNIAAIIFVVIVITVAVMSSMIISDKNSVNLSDDVKIEVTDGMTMKSVAEILRKNGVIKFPFVFSHYSQKGGFDKQLKKGVITVKDGMSYDDILNLLINAKPQTVKIVIPEGFEADEIANAVSSIVKIDDFNKALNEEYDFKFLKDLPKREYRLEGYLFPATYEFEKDATAEDIVKTMLKAFDEAFLPEYYERAKEIGMSVDEVITLASIIERESNSDSDRAKISGVFHNRLEKNMRLQSCATVQYILNERKSNLSVEDTKIQSPYNTYVNNGLPLGPIASPGIDCIKAALYPEKTDALYFVLGSDGKHIFSKTYEEHIAAKNESSK